MEREHYDGTFRLQHLPVAIPECRVRIVCQDQRASEYDDALHGQLGGEWRGILLRNDGGEFEQPGKRVLEHRVEHPDPGAVTPGDSQKESARPCGRALLFWALPWIAEQQIR